MAKLKAVVLSVRDVILDSNDNTMNNDIYNELILFIKFCSNRNIKIFLHSNDCWEFDAKDFGTYFTEKSGCEVTYYNPIKFRDLPRKPKASSIEYILHSNSLTANEVICIGATDNDMRTYVNGKVLFLKASWYHSSLKYGFNFDSLKDIARFIETCCLRDHLWFHKFNIHPIIYYSLSPFSTLKEDFKDYSTSARFVTKHGIGLLDFWLQLLIASIYFSDLNDNFDYLVAYPGHKAGSGNSLMDKHLDTLAKALRKKYLPDFLIRHKDSIKSQTARQNGIKLDIFNQLNTLVLNKTPQQGLNGKPYTSIIPTRQKTVILIDDICTSGHSLDAGRIFLKQAGLKVICFSLLKTINVPFTFMINPPEFNPYVINDFHSIFNNCNISTLETPYKSMIVDSSAPIEINEIFNKFKSWDWS